MFMFIAGTREDPQMQHEYSNTFRLLFASALSFVFPRYARKRRTLRCLVRRLYSSSG